MSKIHSFLQTSKTVALKWFENAFFTQAVCTLVSSPILLGWSMVFSKMSIVGNILFAPFMTAFIFLSAIIFLFGLVGLQPKAVFYTFERFVDLWFIILRKAGQSWLFIPGLGLSVLWLFGLSGFIYLSFGKAKNLRLAKRFLIIWLVAFTLAAFLPLSLSLHSKKYAELKKGGAKIILKNSSQGPKIIDFGLFGRCQDPGKFVLFTLRPAYLSALGCHKVEALQLTRFSKRALNGALACIKNLSVKKVIVPKNKDSKYLQTNKSEIERLFSQIKDSGVEIEFC